MLELWHQGHLKRDCPKLKIKKGDEIKVESINDVVAGNDDISYSTDYVLSIIESSLFDVGIMDS